MITLEFGTAEFSFDLTAVQASRTSTVITCNGCGGESGNEMFLLDTSGDGVPNFPTASLGFLYTCAPHTLLAVYTELAKPVEMPAVYSTAGCDSPKPQASAAQGTDSCLGFSVLFLIC